MIYLSIDTETTGLNEKTCEILSFSAVLEDTDKPNIPVDDLPHVHFIFKKDFIKGEPYALNLNKDIIEIIKEGKDERLINELQFFPKFREFLKENNVEGKLKVAGKNFSSFDLKFIDILMNEVWDFGSSIKFHHRVLDVGPLFVDFKNDEWIPDLNMCMERAGVKGTVQHCAYEDAKDVIRVLRTKY
jgi:oligoribonuclease (3'-5' exoribonuclease)